MARMFSLCQTTQNLNTGRLFLYRVADKIDNQLYEDRPSELLDHEFSEERRNNNLRADPVQYKNNELGIWEWDDSAIDRAKKTSILFYELSYSEELLLEDEKSVVLKLKEGIVLSEYNRQKILIKIRETEDEYVVVCMDNNMLKPFNGIYRISEEVETIKVYNIKKTSFLSTEKVQVYSEDGIRLPPRFVLKDLDIMHHDFFEIQLKSKAEIISLFIKKQLKLNEITKREKRERKDYFLETLNNYDEIKRFFDEKNLDSRGLNNKIQEFKVRIEEVLTEGNLYDNFCETMIEALPQVTKKFEIAVEENWIKNHQLQREKAQQEMDALRTETNRLNVQYDELKIQIESMQSKEEYIQSSINNLMAIHEGLKVSLEQKISSVKSNISDFFAEATLYQSILGFGSSKLSNLIIEDRYMQSSNHIILTPTTSIEGEIEEIDSCNDLIFLLEQNLEVAGVIKGYKSSVSEYIIASISQTKSLCLVGYCAREVAMAISATIYGVTPDILTIHKTNEDIASINVKITESHSQVVLIENGVGYLDEQICIQLIKVHVNKRIIFSMEFAEQLNFIPKSMLNYINLLCLDNLCELKMAEKYKPSLLLDNVLVVSSNEIGIKTYSKAAHEVGTIVGLPKINSAFRGILLATMDDYNKNAMFAWLLCEIVPYMNAVGRSVEAIELINDKDLSERNTEILCSLCKSDQL